MTDRTDSPCKACYGKGWNDEWKAVDGHYDGGEVFRVECALCGGSGTASPADALQRYSARHATGHTGQLYPDPDGMWVLIDDVRAMMGQAQPTADAQAGPLTDERCDEIANGAYTALRATGWNGGMGGQTWDRALVRAALAAPAPPQQPAPLAQEPRYRLLERGEIIEATDEFLSDDAKTWAAVPDNAAVGIFLGMAYAPAVFRPGRRALRDDSKDQA